MRYFNLLLVIALVGCKSIGITDANKVLVKKGNKLGTDFIEYSVILNAENDFFINNLTIEGSPETIKFYYKNLNTGLSSYSLLNPFPKGKYSLNFKVNETSNFPKEEFLILEYTVGANQKTTKILIEKNEKITVRR
jgi:hypothetical protein